MKMFTVFIYTVCNLKINELNMSVFSYDAEFAVCTSASL